MQPRCLRPPAGLLPSCSRSVDSCSGPHAQLGRRDIARNRFVARSKASTFVQRSRLKRRPRQRESGGEAPALLRNDMGLARKDGFGFATGTFGFASGAVRFDALVPVEYTEAVIASADRHVPMDTLPCAC